MGVLWRALGMQTPRSLGKPVGGGLKVGCEGTGVFEWPGVRGVQKGRECQILRAGEPCVHGDQSDVTPDSWGSWDIEELGQTQSMGKAGYMRNPGNRDPCPWGNKGLGFGSAGDLGDEVSGLWGYWGQSPDMWNTQLEAAAGLSGCKRQTTPHPPLQCSPPSPGKAIRTPDFAMTPTAHPYPPPSQPYVQVPGKASPVSRRCGAEPS